MELKRRFIFHGDAVAIGGWIVRPENIALDPRCASTLPVTGGRTTGAIKGMRFGPYLRFASASSLAEGRFDDRKQSIALTHGKVREEDLATTTTVRAELVGLVAGIDPQLTVKRIRASFTAKSSTSAEGETAVKLGADVALDGVEIGGHKLMVDLNKALFQEHDTYTKLKRAATDPVCVKNNACSFLTGATVAGQPQQGELVEARGTVYATIVRGIRWSGKPYPGATIDGHVVKVPEFGRIYFGEILISRDARRLTMIRMEFGSPFGGSAACGDVQDNGGWSP